MTRDDYARIAQAAKTFQRNQQLSPHRRSIAQSLYELASQLTDPDYGCPAETRAVMMMYQHLLNATSLPHCPQARPYNQSRTEQGFPRSAAGA